MTADMNPSAVVDPRAVLVRLGVANAGPGTASLVAEPAMGPSVDSVVIDGSTVPIRLDRRDHEHAVLIRGDSDGSSRDSVLMLPPARAAGPSGGVTVREIIVDGWRIVVEIESARRAALRERAQTTQGDGAKAGPTEMRATIPGRVLAVSIAPGDLVDAGQPLIVVEAMKMQNELRSPRAGIVARVAIGPGKTIEVGDLLLVLE